MDLSSVPLVTVKCTNTLIAGRANGITATTALECARERMPFILIPNQTSRESFAGETI
jgi:hypothetical protein